jgi:hypothetical protein
VGTRRSVHLVTSGSTSRSSRGDRPPLGWTAADQAELDAVTWALLRGLSDHAERCSLCLERLDCPSAQAAVDACVDWLTARQLLSRAEWLRERQLDLEAGRRILKRSRAA